MDWIIDKGHIYIIKRCTILDIIMNVFMVYDVFKYSKLCQGRIQ